MNITNIPPLLLAASLSMCPNNTYLKKSQYTVNFYSNYTPLVRHYYDVDKVKSASSFTAFTFFFSLLTAGITPH